MTQIPLLRKSGLVNQRTNQFIVRTYSYPDATYNRGWNGPEKVKEIHLDTSVPSIIHAGTALPTVSLSNNIQINSLKAILLSRYDINLSSPFQSVYQDRANRINRYSSASGITMVLRGFVIFALVKSLVSQMQKIL